ncbi:MAG: DUF885 family protein [Balneolaceae bacterium]
MKKNHSARYLFPTIILLFVFFAFNGCTGQGDRLHELMDEAEQFQTVENPFRGDDDDESERDDELWSESIEDLERRNRFWKEIQEKLEQEVSREGLELTDQITYDSFERQVKNNVKQFEYQSYLIPINHEGGFYNRLIGLENRVPLDNLNDYENYLGRLRAVPEFFDQNINRMRKGLEIGYTLPRAIFVDDYSYYIETHIKLDPAETGFFEPFNNFPEEIPEEDRRRLEEEAREVISEM